MQHRKNKSKNICHCVLLFKSNHKEARKKWREKLSQFMEQVQPPTLHYTVGMGSSSKINWILAFLQDSTHHYITVVHAINANNYIKYFTKKLTLKLRAYSDNWIWYLGKSSIKCKLINFYLRIKKTGEKSWAFLIKCVNRDWESLSLTVSFLSK
jgi:hypothetical protein